MRTETLGQRPEPFLIGWPGLQCDVRAVIRHHECMRLDVEPLLDDLVEGDGSRGAALRQWINRVGEPMAERTTVCDPLFGQRLQSRALTCLLFA